MQLLRLKCTRMHEASCRFPVARLLLFVCRFPPTPPPMGGRTTMEGEWEDSEKTEGEKNRGRLGCLKTPVFQIPSAHKPPARCVRHNAFLMLRLSTVYLLVGFSLIFITKVVFHLLAKTEMHASFKKHLVTNYS